MDQGGGQFPLTVSIPAEHWGFIQRRVRYLEAAIVQILRDKGRFREWYSATELAGLKLPGLPSTRQGISKSALTGNWLRRNAGKRCGRLEYHCASLPARAFDALICRILATGPDNPPTAGGRSSPTNRLDQPRSGKRIERGNTAPPWLLPLMRVIRSQTKPDAERAVAELPTLLPSGTPCPSLDEACEVLRRLGIAV